MKITLYVSLFLIPVQKKISALVINWRCVWHFPFVTGSMNMKIPQMFKMNSKGKENETWESLIKANFYLARNNRQNTWGYTCLCWKRRLDYLLVPDDRESRSYLDMLMYVTGRLLCISNVSSFWVECNP